MTPNALRGFIERTEGRTTALLRESTADELIALDVMDPPKFLSRCEVTEYSGRAKPLRVRLSSGRTAVVRQYRRGGLLRSMLGGMYAFGNRPFEEASVSEHLMSREILTIEVLAAVRVARPGFGYSGLLVTRELDNASPLRQVVPMGQDERAVLVKNVPLAFRAMHDAGVAHHDLTVDNVLVRDGAVYIVDFDGCRVSNEVDVDRRLDDLMRFRRSTHKNSLAVDVQEWRKFMGSYASGDERIAGRIDEWMEAFDRRLFWYRLAWRLGL